MKFVLAFALVTVVAGQVAVSAMETESDDMVIIEPDQGRFKKKTRQITELTLGLGIFSRIFYLY